MAYLQSILKLFCSCGKDATDRVYSQNGLLDGEYCRDCALRRMAVLSEQESSDGSDS